jgi:predicted dehydrogenase
VLTLRGFHWRSNLKSKILNPKSKILEESPMSTLDRRDFLHRSTKAGLGIAAGGALLAAAEPRAIAADERVAANDKIVLAVVGIRGRGAALAQGFAERPDCEVAYLCDVDSSLFESRAKPLAELKGCTPDSVQDFRRALDDKAVDAVVIATPDHWHAPATVLACQAEKHVYVEKPASQSAWEGRKMVEAARRYDRVVQLGTQNRSAPYNIAAKRYIEDGKLGKIHLCRVYNQKHWGNLQAVADSDPPAHLDWDMWTGPAPESRYNVNYHNGWNHFWRFSGGDIINDGVHQMDLARWLIGKDYPRTVYSVGGRFGEQGVFETPDTQIATYEFDDLVMTFELSLYTPYMIKSDMELRNSDMYPYWLQNGTRVEIFGDQGLMVAGRHGDGWQVFAKQHRREPVTSRTPSTSRTSATRSRAASAPAPTSRRGTGARSFATTPTSATASAARSSSSTPRPRPSSATPRPTRF